MSFEEKLTWVNAAITVVVTAWYVQTVAPQLGATPVTEIAYQRPILVAAGALVVLTIVGAIATAIGTAVGGAISAELSGRAPAKDLDVDRKDERDARIGQRGDLVGFYAASPLLFGVLVLTLLEQPYFWIANGLFVAFLTSGLVSAAVKLVAYRRGF